MTKSLIKLVMKMSLLKKSFILSLLLWLPCLAIDLWKLIDVSRGRLKKPPAVAGLISCVVCPGLCVETFTLNEGSVAVA